MVERIGGDGAGALPVRKDPAANEDRLREVLAATEEGVVRDIPLDAIEPDPAQPRRVFDEEKLRSLAESIRKYGVLQEPGVVPLAGGPRYRIVWGERRWRAARLAGLELLRCKVLPPADASALEVLRSKERQWVENMEREGLSPIEEAIAIQDAVDVERSLRPNAVVGELIEKIGAGRGLNGIVARNLVGLLKAPRSLQSAMMGRSIGREVGFELARFWNKLLAENELRGAAKREIQYRNLVEAWVRARGKELDAQSMNRYAGETFQDPKVVKATCRKAEESQRAAVERFDAVVTRAQKEVWTVEKARAELAALRRKAGGKPSIPVPCFEQGGKERTRLTVHLDRVRDPAVATPQALADLLGLLRDLTAEIEARRAAPRPASAG
jgi:ParB family chromosome partitioning protein